MNDMKPQNTPESNSNWKVAAGLFVMVGMMVGLSYAAVPLYQIFCQVTGFAGTTQKAEKASDEILEQKITVRFDANTDKKLPWKFLPVQRKIDIRIGESVLVHYKAVNNSNKPVTGTATFNVTPAAAGVYFNKIECFCFTEQTLKPGESVDMPVTFFIDPEITRDADSKGIQEITLSYTFYRVKEDRKSASVAEQSSSGKSEIRVR